MTVIFDSAACSPSASLTASSLRSLPAIFSLKPRLGSLVSTHRPRRLIRDGLSWRAMSRSSPALPGSSNTS